MKISMWATRGINPITEVSYHVVIDPMTKEENKIRYSTESKFGMAWFVVKEFIKLYIKFTNEVVDSKVDTKVAADKIMAGKKKIKKVYRKKYKNNSKKLQHSV